MPVRHAMKYTELLWLRQQHMHSTNNSSWLTAFDIAGHAIKTTLSLQAWLTLKAQHKKRQSPRTISISRLKPFAKKKQFQQPTMEKGFAKIEFSHWICADCIKSDQSAWCHMIRKRVFPSFSCTLSIISKVAITNPFVLFISFKFIQSVVVARCCNIFYVSIYFRFCGQIKPCYYNNLLIDHLLILMQYANWVWNVSHMLIKASHVTIIW